MENDNQRITLIDTQKQLSHSEKMMAKYSCRGQCKYIASLQMENPKVQSQMSCMHPVVTA